MSAAHIPTYAKPMTGWPLDASDDECDCHAMPTNICPNGASA